MMRKMLVNNFGLTIVTTMEEEHLMAKYTFDKISLAISGFYELDHEENLLLLLQHKVPNGNINADFLQRMKLRGMGMVLKMADKDTITINSRRRFVLNSSVPNTVPNLVSIRLNSIKGLLVNCFC